MKDFRKEELIRPNVAVHCETEEEAKELLTWLDSLGRRWGSDTSYLEETYWFTNTKSIVYYPFDNSKGNFPIAEPTTTLIKFKDIKEKEMVLNDLKTGMRITFGGIVYAVQRNAVPLLARTDYVIGQDLRVVSLSVFHNADTPRDLQTPLMDVESFTSIITKVEAPRTPHDLSQGYKTIWERENVKEITIPEIEAKFGCKVKIIDKK